MTKIFFEEVILDNKSVSGFELANKKSEEAEFKSKRASRRAEMQKIKAIRAKRSDSLRSRGIVAN